MWRNSLNRIFERSGINKLEAREKWALVACGAVVLIFLIVQLVFEPFYSAWQSLAQSITRRQGDLATIQLLQEEHRQLKEDEGTLQTRLQARSPGFTLFTFLDQQAEQAQVKKQISYMKPSVDEGEGRLNEAMVEMKLQRITLDSLVTFIRGIESSENVVFLRRLSIQESSKSESGFLDAVLQIVTFTLKEST
jgi:general secretion pathway protein M